MPEDPPLIHSVGILHESFSAVNLFPMLYIGNPSEKEFFIALIFLFYIISDRSFEFRIT